jgi:chorismate mutase
VNERFDEIRAEITANDRALIDGVNVRLRLVAELWQIKQDRGLGRTDPGRERELLETLATTNDGPLSDDGLAEFVTGLLALTRREIEKGDGASQAPPR